ncbi:hypothetical protein AVEN_260733-1 [Araneus ventricosus]|uniref:Uncharacterized protein n=1 Tax=Araneus ventricosus TaxID=182803 RepID=A0A4Y2T0C2_ARAVE|nr:hypothetical protein AVEN_85480-1 [Araneus ventricosus]GBN93363.1 hypothetical protein AVEN_109168-1 [Araneus ventricosus]GBN93969.1 hypothetical protein AVEN_59255-1 [Araneus ventricosus]GBN93990.1 hypothetical protein AVEN_260733-1 [Araneus ventricosus]
MGAEGPHTDRKTTRIAISLEGFCSWTIMQDPTQQGTQKNTSVTWNWRDWITRPRSCPIRLSPTLKSALSGRHFRSNEEVHHAVKNFLRHRFLPGWLPETDFTVRQTHQCR